jgi:amidase
MKRLCVAFHLDNGVVSPTPATVETVRRTARALADAGAALDEARPAGIEQMLHGTIRTSRQGVDER